MLRSLSTIGSRLQGLPACTQVRHIFFAKDPKPPPGKTFTFPHPIDHATGEEKKLLLLEEMGITDPYLMEPVKRTENGGTKDNPYIIKMFEDKRMIGCVCEEDATLINYMWVHKEEPRRCDCGYWFKAVKLEDGPFAALKKDGKEPTAAELMQM